MSGGEAGVEGQEAPTHGQPRGVRGKEELPLTVVATDTSSTT